MWGSGSYLCVCRKLDAEHLGGSKRSVSIWVTSPTSPTENEKMPQVCLVCKVEVMELQLFKGNLLVLEPTKMSKWLRTSRCKKKHIHILETSRPFLSSRVWQYGREFCRILPDLRGRCWITFAARRLYVSKKPGSGSEKLMSQTS